ncbi:MAG: hypothetical protein ACP5GI_07645 [Sulfolobales archaeon]
MDRGIIVRGYVEDIDNNPVAKLSIDEELNTLNIEKKIYAIAISTPYGCVIGIGLLARSASYKYMILSLLNPLNEKDLATVRKILDLKKLTIKINTSSSESEYFYELSDEDAYKLEYVMNKTRECDLSMNKNINLDKAFDWIIENFG